MSPFENEMREVFTGYLFDKVNVIYDGVSYDASGESISIKVTNLFFFINRIDISFKFRSFSYNVYSFKMWNHLRNRVKITNENRREIELKKLIEDIKEELK